MSSSAEPIVRNGRPPSAHSVHSFLHQYTGSFKKPPLRRPQSVIGGGLGSLMVMPRNGSRLGETHTQITLDICISCDFKQSFCTEALLCVNRLKLLQWLDLTPDVWRCLINCWIALKLHLKSLYYTFLLSQLSLHTQRHVKTCAHCSRYKLLHTHTYIYTYQYNHSSVSFSHTISHLLINKTKILTLNTSSKAAASIPKSDTIFKFTTVPNLNIKPEGKP